VKRILAVLLLAVPVAAQAVDGVSAELGKGETGLNVWRVGLQWNQRPRFLEDTDLRLFWDASVGGWNVEGQTVNDLGLTPTFRYSPHGRTFVEAAIGFHLVSDVHVRRDYDISTRFQFGDHIGVGYQFENFNLGLRLQHLSNGGIRNPNPGVNILLLRFEVPLR
jgi:hypothetical protein